MKLHKDCVPVDEWAQDAAHKLGTARWEKANAEEISTRKAIEHQQRAVAFWDQLVEHLRHHCEEFNKAMGRTYLVFKMVRSDQFRLKLIDAGILRVSFLDWSRIYWIYDSDAGAQKKGQWSFTAEELAYSWSLDPNTPKEIARELLNEVLALAAGL